MPYQVPELNTQGADFTNTLLRIKQDKDTNKYRNAMLEMQQQNQRNEQMKSLFSHAREGLAWVEANVAQGNPQAYANYREHMVKNMGMPEEALPSYEAFVDTGVDQQTGQPTQTFNQDRFTKWANRAMMQADDVVKSNFGNTKDYTQKVAYGPGGKTMMVSIKKDENFDPEQEIGPGWSLATPDKPKESQLKEYKTRGGGLEYLTEEEAKSPEWRKKLGGARWKEATGGGGGGGKKSGGGSGKMSDFEREYQDYVSYANQYHPGKRVMTRGEYKLSQKRAAKSESPLQFLENSGGGSTGGGWTYSGGKLIKK